MRAVRCRASLTLRGLLPGTPRRGIASQKALASLRSAGPEIRPGVGARPGNVKEVPCRPCVRAVVSRARNGFRNYQVCNCAPFNETPYLFIQAVHIKSATDT
eukprot:1186971-Prorocentrum_minimum.AAC.4